jgi:hypothetical protein
MERIRCPHCNAVNQDVEPSDACWQCGKPLGAPAVAQAVVKTPAAISPVVSAETPQVMLPAVPKSGQAAPSLEERVAARKAARKRTNPAIPALVVALILIVLAAIYFALHQR